jgi:PAS domain S-box-containing protein
MNPKRKNPIKPDQNSPVFSSISPIHLLLVEDNPGDARLVYEMLRNQLHIKLEVADCLAACMIRLDQGGIDLVLLDLGLSDSQGLDTLTSVTQAHLEMPVVALTGLDDDALALRTVQAGGQDYLTKNTVTPEILRRTIRHAFERKRVELQIKMAFEALKRSEENFHRSLEDSPLGVRIATAKGETIFANKVLLEIYGHANAEELNKIPLKARYTPQSYAEFQLRKKSRDQGDFGPSEYEIDIVRKNGEIRHLLVFRNEVFWDGAKQFQVIYQDITERKQAESQKEDALAALRKSEEKFRKIFEDHAAVKLLIEPESGAIIDANKAAEQYYGWTRAELKRMHIQQINTLPAEQVKIEMEKAQQQKCTRFEFRHRRADGSIRDVEVFSSKVEMAGKDILHSIIQDITERKLAEKKVKNSLEEKEVLLKEVHHRVKNNLMTIIGLIKLEETKANNKMFDPLLQELEGRIRAMALVHESLYKSEDLAHIDLRNYIETMSAQISAQFGAERAICFSVQGTGVEVELDIAVPCGLILNELITNAYKHAFPDNKAHAGDGNCAITVTINRDADAFMLTVADNGVGLSAGTNWENPETLGLRLVKMLSQQINGSIEVERDYGTVFHLRFEHLSS